MTLRLSRNQLFLAGTGIILFFIVLNRLVYISGSAITTGKVIGIQYGNSRSNYVYSSNRYREGSYSFPVIQFNADSLRITFSGEHNVDLAAGETVSVIYKKKDPSQAKVYSFSGFWMAPLLYGLLPLLILAAVVFSFLEPKDHIQLIAGGKIKFGKTAVPAEQLPQQENKTSYAHRK